MARLAIWAVESCFRGDVKADEVLDRSLIGGYELEDMRGCGYTSSQEDTG